MNITFTNHQQHGQRSNMGNITAQTQRDVGFAAISGRHARFRALTHGMRKISSWLSVGLHRSR